MSSDKLKKIQSLDIFQDLKQEELAVIDRSSEYLHLKNNEPLFHENDPIKNVYIIVYGSFKILRKSKQDDSVIFNFLGRNEVLGISMARLPNPQFRVSAIANEESCVLKMSLPDFNKLFLKNPLLEPRIQLQLTQRFLDFQEDRCSRKSLAAQRLADFLLRTLDRQPLSCRQQIIIPLTRNDIARRIGSENETVVRLMSQWTKNGWIETHSKHVEILNRQALEDLKAPPMKGQSA